jgi:HPt (histidine-containing phosphotransfer) domain-containing protein
MADPIDTSVLDELEEAVGAEFLVELVETFLAEAPVMMADLRAGHEKEDADGLRRAAHSLKSNANTFGATVLAEAAREIEVHGLGASPDAGLASVAECLDAAVDALRRRINA